MAIFETFPVTRQLGVYFGSLLKDRFRPNFMSRHLTLGCTHTHNGLRGSSGVRSVTHLGKR